MKGKCRFNLSNEQCESEKNRLEANPNICKIDDFGCSYEPVPEEPVNPLTLQEEFDTHGISTPNIVKPSGVDEDITIRGILDSVFDLGVNSVGAFGEKETDENEFAKAEKTIRRKLLGELGERFENVGCKPDCKDCDVPKILKDMEEQYGIT